jgi:hypothetical protein
VPGMYKTIGAALKDAHTDDRVCLNVGLSCTHRTYACSSRACDEWCSCVYVFVCVPTYIHTCVHTHTHKHIKADCADESARAHSNMMLPVTASTSLVLMHTRSRLAFPKLTRHMRRS